MMDMLKIKIATKFMKGFVAKMLSKKVYEKFGCKVDIQFEDIDVDTINGDVIIHVDAKGKINRSEFERLIDKIN